MTISGLGPVMQLAFVPRDFDAAVDHWARVMGVGPFFHMQHLTPPAMWYRGHPTRFDFSIALAYWGDIQIELIQQHDDVPSIYSDWSKAGRSGVHHVCQMVDDIDCARAAFDREGCEILQEVALDEGHAIYGQTLGGLGIMFEVIQSPPPLIEMFEMIKSASIGWDGADPLRIVG
jgi:methylmalonyl-CoA/ethylmalonyl-CoA epimerase